MLMVSITACLIHLYLLIMDKSRVNYIHIAGHDEDHGAAEDVKMTEGESFNMVKGELRHLPTLLVDTHGEAVQKLCGIHFRVHL